MGKENDIIEIEEEFENEEELDSGIMDALDVELEAVAKDDAAEPENVEINQDDNAEVQVSEGDSVTPEVEEPGDDKSESEAKPADDAESKPETEPEQKTEGDAEKKPSDEFGQLDKDVPEKTRERFETLKSRFDEVASERDSIVKERDQILADADIWKTAITSTGTTPEQFSMALEYLGKVNSSKPEDLEAAYSIMQGELETLGKQLGKKSPGVYDPLSEHADLQEKVRTGLIDEDIAYEIAESRAKNKLSSANSQKTQKENEEQYEINTAMDEVKKLSASLKASDPHFEAKLPYMEPLIITAVKSGAPPSKWKSMIEEAYKNMPNPVMQKPAPALVPDPLRPTTTPGASNLKADPGSEMEALNQALERGY